jgi:tetratricopeptide (TPR) repeat protein
MTAAADELSSIVSEFAGHGDVSRLRSRMRRFVTDVAPDVLVNVVEPYRDEPEVVAPAYERVIEAQPDNARALVILANAYWLQGRGPEAVGALANRAIAADPSNRGAWHLWALSESDPRSRTQRWAQVAARFPGDDLALAAFADNATSVAGAEKDYEMLDAAIDAYERLLARATETPQRTAVETALSALRGWRF